MSWRAKKTRHVWVWVCYYALRLSRCVLEYYAQMSIRYGEDDIYSFIKDLTLCCHTGRKT